MESEYYEITADEYNYIAHKSCKFDGKYFSNAKYTLKESGIAKLKKRCELVDKITKNINLPIGYSKSMGSHKKCIYLFLDNIIYYNDITYRTFNNYDELYEYISQNEQHLIINHDIKIALKD